MSLRATLSRVAHQIWSDTGMISALLLPFSWLTQFIVNRKVVRYSKNPHLVWKSNLPVVVVGNIYVGGTGKTPVVMALVDLLIQKGWRPGVVSRGYGIRVGHQARTGKGALDASQFGDEPALIAQTTGVPVSVHPSRTKAAQALIKNYPELNIIVADDGLQHLALGRDLEIVVQDKRGIGNGRLLPAGPLREPASKLDQVDVVVTNIDAKRDSACPTSSHVSTASGGPIQIRMTLAPHEVIHVNTGRRLAWTTWLSRHQNTPLNAVAAIGHPERFFEMLRHYGLSVQNTRALPDHTRYLKSIFDQMDEQIILITTKDAIKCHTLDNDRVWAVSVTPAFSDPHWFDSIQDTLADVACRKRHEAGDRVALN